MLIQPGMPMHYMREKIVEYTQMFALSDRFGWAPETIRKMEDLDRRGYLAMLAGYGDARTEKEDLTKKNGSNPGPQGKP